MLFSLVLFRVVVHTILGVIVVTWTGDLTGCGGREGGDMVIFIDWYGCRCKDAGLSLVSSDRNQYICHEGIISPEDELGFLFLEDFVRRSDIFIKSPPATPPEGSSKHNSRVLRPLSIPQLNNKQPI